MADFGVELAVKGSVLSPLRVSIVVVAVMFCRWYWSCCCVFLSAGGVGGGVPPCESADPIRRLTSFSPLWLDVFASLLLRCAVPPVARFGLL